jgi:hypothetical protein
MASLTYKALLFLLILPYEAYGAPLQARQVTEYSEVVASSSSTMPLSGIDWTKFGVEVEQPQFAVYNVEAAGMSAKLSYSLQTAHHILMADYLNHDHGHPQRDHMSDLLAHFESEHNIQPSFLALPNVVHPSTRGVLKTFRATDTTPLKRQSIKPLSPRLSEKWQGR